MERIYIIQEREFIKTNENIYKIGRSRQIKNRRLNQYPKGSEILLILCVDDCYIFESNIKKIFNKKFKNRSDIGTEYYEGNIKKMVQEIIKLFNDEENLNDDNSEDVYLQFLNENTENDENMKARIHCGTLYGIFENWYKINNPNIKVPNNKEFINNIKKHKNLTKIKIEGRTRLGLKNIKIIYQ